MSHIEIEHSPVEDVAVRADNYRDAVALFKQEHGSMPSPAEAIELARFLSGDYS